MFLGAVLHLEEEIETSLVIEDTGTVYDRAPEAYEDTSRFFRPTRADVAGSGAAMKGPGERHDVIVLGSGMGGSTMAAILARHGFDVVMLEKGAHPRFALGESTLPQASYWMWLLSERYDVPELKLLADAGAVVDEVTQTCGVKRSIGFAYHRAGQPHDVANESHQFLAPEMPFISESHFFREDIDLYLVRLAQDYGAALHENTEVVAVEDDTEEIRVTVADGSVHRARYLVDASGRSSIVASTYDLHDEPTRLETQSRAIFSHFEGLKVYDELFSEAELPGYKHRWHDGTVHHIFDGGWFWVIPFDNNEACSINHKASIGLMLDTRKHPRQRGVTPEEEFEEYVERFPTVAEHFEEIEAVRPYIGTDRLQFSCKNAIGPRYFITPQAYGLVDALYSRGLISTFESLYVFANRLIGALRDDDFSPARFEGLDELQRHQLDSHDQMVMNGYRAFADFDAWNAWLKVWIASKLYGDLWLLRTTMKYMHTHDGAYLDRLDLQSPPFADVLQETVDLGGRALHDAEEGTLTWDAAADVMTGAMQETDWLPHHTYAWGRPEIRHGDFTPMLKMPLAILWGKTLAPKWVKNELFDFPSRPLVKMQAGETIQKLRGM